MDTFMKLPFYVRASIFLVGAYAALSVLYITQGIILPLIYATIFAVLISSPVNFLIRKKLNRVLSVSVVMFTVFVLVTGLILLLSSQVSRLNEGWPKLVDKATLLLDHTVSWASSYFNISAPKIDSWIDSEKNELLNHSTTVLGITITTMGSAVAAIILIPVYIFMILYYQPHLIEFIHKVFGASNDNKVSEILHETKTIIKSYLMGLFSEFAIVAILNSVGFLILRFDYAILLGVAGAFLNAIPFIGGIIGVALYVIIALVTKSPIYVLYVLILHALIQFIDNHFIVPKIVGSKVRLNALVCLIAVIAGGALWGIPGMFLAIPLTGTVKVVCDRMESLKVWGFFLGDGSTGHQGIDFASHIKDFIQNFKSKNTNPK